MRFVGRRRERDTLERAYGCRASGFIPVYGRRRVGKSRLILEFLRDKPGIYGLGKQAPAAFQRREFLRQAAVALDQPLLASAEFPDWGRTLEAVVQAWQGERRLVLVLDEFQWMVGASPELPSVLQELWDCGWRDSGRVLLLLCGSYLGFMEREVLGARSPLFGRRTGQILLRPFGYDDTVEFHPGYSVSDRARVYFVCGGMPHYLLAFSDERSVEQNLMEQILDEHAMLFREPEFLLREELRELERYSTILTTLATGSLAQGELARRCGLDTRAIPYYLTHLRELGYVARRFPLSGRAPASREIRYSLEEPLLRFWFRFIFPNQSFLAQRGAEPTLRDRIRPELDAYFGGCFERLCRERLPALYAHEGVAATYEVGEFWDRQVQIDVVGVRDDHWVDVGECKWGSVTSVPALCAELEAKVRCFPNPALASIGRRIFTQHPLPHPPQGPPHIRCHSLADLAALPAA